MPNTRLHHQKDWGMDQQASAIAEHALLTFSEEDRERGRRRTLVIPASRVRHGRSSGDRYATPVQSTSDICAVDY